MAKALGNGMPIGAAWAKDEVASSFVPGDHGSTFGGQPLACSAALATLGVMKSMDAPGVVSRLGEVFMERLSSIEAITEVRGMGLLLGAELDPGYLDGRQAGEVARRCLEAGLVVNGVTPTALRIAPPFTISEAEINEGFRALESVLGS